tara:strand:+ start:3917 stop:5500 length:1584 start_codon:yes stop_codon:yes gene_type:complete
MALSVGQIFLAIGGGLGDRRTKVKDLYTKERQRQRDYWDVNGSKISNQMDANKTLALDAANGLINAGMSEENLTQLFNTHGVANAITLNGKLQELREKDPTKYDDLINDGIDAEGLNTFTGGLNSLTKLQDTSEEDENAWASYIDQQFKVKEFSPREKEGGKNIFNSITDRLTGRDLEDEHDRFMDEELIGDKTIRQLKELRDRGPEQGKTSLDFDDIQRITPSDFSPMAVRRANIKRDNILADSLKGLQGGDGQLLQFITEGEGSNALSIASQIDTLRKGNTIVGPQGSTYLNPEYFFDILREQKDSFTDADAAVLGFSTLSELERAIRPRKEKALEANIATGDVTKEEVAEIDISTMKEFNTLAEAEKYQNENRQFKGIVYIKNVHDILVITADPIITQEGPPGLSGPGVPIEGGDPAEVSMVPDASNVVAIPLPADGINKKREWQKKYKGKYELDGTPIVVPKRPTTEAEKDLLVSDFGFERSKFNNVNNPDYTLKQIQDNWDKKYGNSHDPSGYPLGYTLKTS